MPPSFLYIYKEHFDVQHREHIYCPSQIQSKNETLRTGAPLNKWAVLKVVMIELDSETGNG